MVRRWECVTESLNVFNLSFERLAITPQCEKNNSGRDKPWRALEYLKRQEINKASNYQHIDLMKCKTLVLQQIKTPLMSMDNEEQKMIKKKTQSFIFSYT